MPLYILAGIAVLINNVIFPLIWAKGSTELATVQVWGNAVTLGTLNFAAVILAGVLGYCFAKNKRFDNPIACVVVGISSFVIMMPQALTATIGNYLVASSTTDKTAEAVKIALTDLKSRFLPAMPFPAPRSQVPS